MAIQSRRSDMLLRSAYDRIATYHPKGNLDHTARLFLCMIGVQHGGVRDHVIRVAFLAEGVARRMQKDPKAAFFAGLFHDTGKLVLPYHLFTNRPITPKEFDEIKTHAQAGFDILKEMHIFVALCASLHHALSDNGYGLSRKDFPAHFAWVRVKAVLDTTTIVSIADFIDAWTSRNDGKVRGTSLKKALLGRYPLDGLTIQRALQEQKRIAKASSLIIT